MHVRELTAGRGLITIVAVALEPPPDAVITVGVELLTAPAVAVKPALAVPPTTVTEEGVTSALLPLERLTVMPPVRAFALN